MSVRRVVGVTRGTGRRRGGCSTRGPTGRYGSSGRRGKGSRRHGSCLVDGGGWCSEFGRRVGLTSKSRWKSETVETWTSRTWPPFRAMPVRPVCAPCVRGTQSLSLLPARPGVRRVDQAHRAVPVARAGRALKVTRPPPTPDCPPIPPTASRRFAPTQIRWGETGGCPSSRRNGRSYAADETHTCPKRQLPTKAA